MEGERRKVSVVSTILITVLAAVVFGVVGFWLGSVFATSQDKPGSATNNQTNVSTNVTTNTTTTNSSNNSTNSTASNSSVSAQSSLTTYTNGKGVTAKYPQGWSAKEVTLSMNEIQAGLYCQYTEFTSSKNDKLIFSWDNVAGADANKTLTCRTGVGAYSAVFVSNVTVLGAPLKMQKFVLDDHLDEVIFSKNDAVGKQTSGNGKYQFYLDLVLADGTKTTDARVTSLLDDAKTIAESIQLP